MRLNAFEDQKVLRLERSQKYKIVRKFVFTC